MRGKTQWNERPHILWFEDKDKVHICRLAPGETDLVLEWLDPKEEGSYFLEWRPLFGNDEWVRREVEGYEAYIDGLTPWRDYAVRIVRKDGEESAVRYFRAAPVPGTVINYLHPQDTFYQFSGRSLCSPSILKLPSGRILASMDVYEGQPDIYEGRGARCMSLLFRSDDRGKTWHYVCDLFPLFWGKLFWHRGRVYMVGVTQEFGDMVIGASDDEGETWTVPTHIFPGSCTVGNGWEQAPQPVLVRNGRIHVAIEYAGRILGRIPCVMSAPEDSDLLDAGNWHVTEPHQVDPALLGIPGARIECFVEGNLFVTPDDELCVMYRVDADGVDVTDGRAAIMRVNEKNPDAPLEFVKFIHMPAGYNNKFMMQYDEGSGYYIAIGNIPVDNGWCQQRKILALLCSKDAEHWEIVTRIIDRSREPSFEVGFQYPSFQFDGDDILLQVRTATNGARNFHDANYATFHVIGNFRELLPEK